MKKFLSLAGLIIMLVVFITPCFACTKNYTIFGSVDNPQAGYVLGSATVKEGEAVTLTAVANTGFAFLKWSDGDLTNPRLISNVQKSQTYIAQFQALAPQTYNITGFTTDATAGFVSGSASVNQGGSVTLTATAYKDHHFTQWSDGNKDNPRTISNVQSSQTFYAEFGDGNCVIVNGFKVVAINADIKISEWNTVWIEENREDDTFSYWWTENRYEIYSSKRVLSFNKHEITEDITFHAEYTAKGFALVVKQETVDINYHYDDMTFDAMIANNNGWSHIAYFKSPEYRSHNLTNTGYVDFKNKSYNRFTITIDLWQPDGYKVNAIIGKIFNVGNTEFVSFGSNSFFVWHFTTYFQFEHGNFAFEVDLRT